MMSEKLDILLLSVGDINDDDRREIPLGIAFLCGQLKSKGYSYHVLDLYNLNLNLYEKFDSKLEESISSSIPKVIGISSTSYYIEMVKKITEKIHKISKKHGKSIPIIIGGYISIIPDILKDIDADVLCYGEGDRTIIELMDFFSKKNNSKQLHEIEGICYRDKSGKISVNTKKLSIKELDSIAFPEFDGFNLKEYKYNNSIPMYSQRGCYNECSFCDIIPFYGDKYIRRMSPNKIIEWIKSIREKYEVKRIDFMDDNFLNSRRHITELFELLDKNFLNNKNKKESLIKINFQARAIEIIRFSKILQQYKKYINCIEIGTESFAQSQLNRWKKNITVLDNLNSIQLLTDNGLSYINYYLWIDDKTTIDELDENIDRILKLPEVKIVGSEITVPNYILNYDISAIYDRYGISSVINIPNLFACETFLNKTYIQAKKMSSVYISLKRLLNTGTTNKSNIEHISESFFPLVEKLMEKRLYNAVDIAEITKKNIFSRKMKLNQIINEKLKEYEKMTDKVFNPIKDVLGINLDKLIEN
ncbi:MAG: radical SAM protein [archaeon]|nr:radical SAM protein [archaeon]